MDTSGLSCPRTATLSLAGPFLLTAGDATPLASDLATAALSGIGLALVVAAKIALGRSFGLAPAREAFVPSHEQRRLRVERDAVDRGQQRDDRERVRDQVGDDPDVRGRPRERLLLQDLDPDLLHVVEEVPQRPLLGEQELEQAHLELEVVMVGGHDLDAAGRPVEELAVRLGGRAQGLLDEHDVAEVVVEPERGQVGGRRGRDVRDDVRARLQLAL